MRNPLFRLIATFIAVAAFATPEAATAQSGPVGIGFAQAEEGTWWCRGDNAVTTLDCARTKCDAEGSGQECYRTAWCYPAGWSGLMTVWTGEFHSTEIICGAPSRDALQQALEVFCNTNPYAERCDVFLFIDPDGVEEEMTFGFVGGANTTPP